MILLFYIINKRTRRHCYGGFLIIIQLLLRFLLCVKYTSYFTIVHNAPPGWCAACPTRSTYEIYYVYNILFVDTNHRTRVFLQNMMFMTTIQYLYSCTQLMSTYDIVRPVFCERLIIYPRRRSLDITESIRRFVYKCNGSCTYKGL